MSHYVSLDVSVKSASTCVVDAAGSILARGDTTPGPDEIAAFIGNHTPDVERVVHESGTLAIWLICELEKRGLLSFAASDPADRLLDPRPLY